MQIKEIYNKANKTDNLLNEAKKYKSADEMIQCICNDPSCTGTGEESEVYGHIEDCPCQHCHSYYSQVITR